MKTMEFTTLQELASHAINQLNDGLGFDTYGSDLHNELFNADYYMIGRHQAEQWLIANGGVFYFIDLIQDYEKNMFGAVNTDLSKPEKLVNMATYIGGESVLSHSPTLQARWDDRLTEADIEAIIDELNLEFTL